MQNLFSKNPSTMLLGFFSLILIFYSHVYVEKGLMQKPRDLLSPPAGIEHFTFGHRDVVADFLWVRAIQDFDYCDQPEGVQQCKGKSWLFRMLDSITLLSPKFRMPYATGAVALSVMVGDVEGARLIFERGAIEFPDDWRILYRAAYHNLYEVKDKKAAAALFRRAGEHGAPQWVYSLAGGLYDETGSPQLAEAILEEMIKTEIDPNIIKRLREKIEKIHGTAKQ